VLVIALAAAWVGGLAASGRDVLRDPLRRACILGTAVTFALFLATSPHHEVRYMYPLVLLVFGVAGLAIQRWLPNEPARVAAAGLLAFLSLATAFESSLMARIAPLMGQALAVTLLVVGAAVLQARVLRLDRKRLALVAIGLVFVPAMPLYVFWTLYLRTYYQKSDPEVGEAGISFAWRNRYPDEAPLWTFVRENVPDDATIALANTYFVYPFFDATWQRRLGHAPVRRGLHDFLHFPRMGDTVPGNVIVKRMTDVQNEDADKATWLENLRRLGAQYLVVATFPHESNPPERRFVGEEPALFEKIFDHPTAGAVYRIHWDAAPTTSPNHTP
jgi:hypothetical protein